MDEMTIPVTVTYTAPDGTDWTATAEMDDNDLGSLINQVEELGGEWDHAAV